MTSNSDALPHDDAAPLSAAPCPLFPAARREYAGRDRALLYIRGMNLDPEAGVTLALESIRRAGRNAGPDKVMDAMFSILREREHSPLLRDAAGSLIASAPPMNRRTVVATDMEQFSLTATVGKFLGSLAARLFRKSRESR